MRIDYYCILSIKFEIQSFICLNKIKQALTLEFFIFISCVVRLVAVLNLLPHTLQG